MIYNKILELKKNHKKGIALLIDPDNEKIHNVRKNIENINNSNIFMILIGGSTLFTTDFDLFTKEVKKYTNKPVVIFPGSSLQISKYADAILFLSLISGRNPQYLIGEQVNAALKLKGMGIEAISTGYMLVESGASTSVEFISNTKPIPRRKSGIILAHAVAAELLGMKLLYLDAGSGARYSVPPAAVKKVSNSVSIPLMVGGGIKSKNEIEKYFRYGADIVVIGTLYEKNKRILKNI